MKKYGDGSMIKNDESGIVELNSPITTPISNKYDLVGTSCTLAFYLPIPFWLIVYNFDLLEQLFPSYKGKELVNPAFIAPMLIGVLAAAFMRICFYIIYEKFEEGHYQTIGFKYEPKLNELLFDYWYKKSYGKLFVVVICWVALFVSMATFFSICFGMFLAFKYLRA